MGLLGFKGMKRFVLFMLVLMAGLGDGKVVLIGKDVTLSFDDVEANFSPVIKGSAECGVLYVVEPVDACTPLKVKVDEGIDPAFALIIRGGCTFDDKVRNAQEAGFKAAIVYNNAHGPLVATKGFYADVYFNKCLTFIHNALPLRTAIVAGTSGHTHIHAVFVSKDSGEALKRHAGQRDIELWIIPTFESSAWSIMAISFISLLAMFAALATCFFVHRHSIRRRQHRDNIREFHGMSSQLVKALPSLRFTSVLEDNSTSATCAICLEDYNFGEKLRILPCLHKFHANCVDAWLTTRRTFCPICKRDARTSTGNLPPSECTPLLSSAASTPNSSFYSSIGIPSALQIPTTLQINPIPPPLPFTNRSHSLSSSIPRVPNLRRSSSHSPPINISRSSMDFRSASYPSSYASSSLGLPRSSPRYSRFMLSYFRSSNNASTSYITGSRSMPAMDSAQSLPEC